MSNLILQKSFTGAIYHLLSTMDEYDVAMIRKAMPNDMRDQFQSLYLGFKRKFKYKGFVWNGDVLLSNAGSTGESWSRWHGTGICLLNMLSEAHSDSGSKERVIHENIVNTEHYVVVWTSSLAVNCDHMPVLVLLQASLLTPQKDRDSNGINMLRSFDCDIYFNEVGNNRK